MVHLTTALEPGSRVPLYEQLYRSLAGEMRTGALPAGTRMPGKRRLAAELSVSVNTVDAAYQILAAEGYLEPKERSGFYVQEYLALPQVGPDARGPSPTPAVPEPAAPEPPVRYDLSTRGVDPGLFPFRTWARLQKELLYSSPELLTNGDAQGDLALRQALADYLAEYRGVQCGAHQVVVGAGLEYLLGLLAPLLHGTAAVETPGETVEFAAESFSIYIVVSKENSTVNSYTKEIGDTFTIEGSGWWNHSWQVEDGQEVVEIVRGRGDSTVTLRALAVGTATVKYSGSTLFGSVSETFTIQITEKKSVSIDDTILTDGSLTAVVEGVETPTYQWYRAENPEEDGNYLPVEDATESKLFVAADGARRYYYVEVTDENGVKHTSEHFQVEYYDSLQNGTFESPDVMRHPDRKSWAPDRHTDPSYFIQIGNGSNGLYWRTTGSDRKVEIADGSSAKTAYNTTRRGQFAELNCEAVGALYQDILTEPGSTLYWGLEHSGRNGEETMQVIITGTKDLPSNWNPAGQIQTEGVQATITDGVDSWKFYTQDDGEGPYVVPEGQYVTRFYFISSGEGLNNTHGNLLDNISFGKERPTPPPQYGSLTITKDVTGISKSDVPQNTFAFAVKDDSGDVVRNVTLPDSNGSWTATITVDPGNYTVEETPGSIGGYTLDTINGKSSGTSGYGIESTTVSTDEPGTVTFTNAYTAAGNDAWFFVRTDGFVPLEDGTTGYNSNDYLPKHQTEGALVGKVTGEAAWTNHNGVINAENGTLNGVALSEAFAEIRDYIVEYPTDDEIEAAVPGFDSENQAVAWYVVKTRNKDNGCPGWHVDGVVYNKGTVPGQVRVLNYFKNDGETTDAVGYSIHGVNTVAAIKDDSDFADFTRDGYEFLGWDENPNAETPTYPDGGDNTILMDQDRNLYAIWREIPKTASFYLNKVDSEDGGVFLDGAAFRMWDADKQSVYFVKSGNTYTYTADSSASGATDTLTSVSSDKAVQIVGLPVGVYYLEETAHRLHRRQRGLQAGSG